jgi:hypothetical protein
MTLARSIFAFSLLVSGLTFVQAQEKVYKLRLTDNQNRQYSLTQATLSGANVFHCRLKDTLFTIAFDQVRSLTVNPQADSPFKGFVLANFVLAAGNAAQAYVDLDNYWVEGTEVNFNVRIKIKLIEVVRLDLTTEVKPPPPSIEPAPSPTPSSAPALDYPAPAPTASPSLSL